MSEYCVTDSVNNTFDYTNIIKSPQEMYDDNNKTSSKQLRTLVGYMKNIVEKDDYVLKDAKLELGNKYFFNTGLKCQGNIGYNKPIYKVVNNIPPDDKGLINGIINNIKQINPQYLMKSIFNTNKISSVVFNDYVDSFITVTFSKYQYIYELNKSKNNVKWKFNPLKIFNINANQN